MCDLGLPGSDPSATDPPAVDEPSTEHEPAVDASTAREGHAEEEHVSDTSWRGRRTCTPRGWFGPSKRT